MNSNVPPWTIEQLITAPEPGARSISFSLFGTKKIYTKGAIDNALLALLLYPGWICRFYCATDVAASTIEALLAAGAQVWRCTGVSGRALVTLRFLPLAEPGVAICIVRDPDSRLNPREAAAVREWLGEGAEVGGAAEGVGGRQFHAMHEEMHMPTELLGGMWGARADSGCGGAALPGLDAAIARSLSVDTGGELEAYGGDMALLRREVQPLLTATNCCHHRAAPVAASANVDGGGLAWELVARPFPLTEYRGFVGQPINCLSCCHALFASTGCAHLNRELPSSVVSKLRCNPDIMLKLNQFL